MVVQVFYINSMKQPARGDRLVADERTGTLDEILEPGSVRSKQFNCEKTGGLLIDFDDYGLTLLPFGMFDEKSLSLVTK
jgi:hypothetical protein